MESERDIELGGVILSAKMLSQSSCDDCHGPIPKSYLCVVGVRLSSGKDASSEEFELFRRIGTGNFPSTTIHRFNGAWRNDEAGNYRHYKDVNSINYTYNMDEPIAIARLNDDDTPAKILPIEDDNNAGEIAPLPGRICLAL
ncbi:MAG: hypothetical protein ACE5EE_09170 [Fidelibacterota bacterium]